MRLELTKGLYRRVTRCPIQAVVQVFCLYEWVLMNNFNNVIFISFDSFFQMLTVEFEVIKYIGTV